MILALEEIRKPEQEAEKVKNAANSKDRINKVHSNPCFICARFFKTHESLQIPIKTYSEKSEYALSQLLPLSEKKQKLAESSPQTPLPPSPEVICERPTRP